MILQKSNPFKNLVFALIFGAIFCLLLTFTPLAVLFRPTDCWDSQDDFLYSLNQLGLTTGACLAFFAQSFLKIQGWKGFLKTIAVLFLCFQAFSIASVFDDIYTQQCYFRQSLGEILSLYWTKILIVSLIKSALAMIVCLPVLIVYRRILAGLPAEKTLD